MEDPRKEPEAMDELERELRQALERRPAPPSLKRKILERRGRQNTERLRRRVVFWQRLAACVLLTGALGGALVWRDAEEQRKGEQAREQVFTALRIANRALSEMNAQLSERNQGSK
jgi:hypothetical protein